MCEEVVEVGESRTVQNQLGLVVTPCHYVTHCSQRWRLRGEREDNDDRRGNWLNPTSKKHQLYTAAIIILQGRWEINLDDMKGIIYNTPRTNLVSNIRGWALYILHLTNYVIACIYDIRIIHLYMQKHRASKESSQDLTTTTQRFLLTTQLISEEPSSWTSRVTISESMTACILSVLASVR